MGNGYALFMLIHQTTTDMNLNILTVLLRESAGEMALCLILFAIAIWGFHYLMNGISKITGTKASYRGKITHSPDDFDKMNNDLKQGAQKVINVFRKINGVAKTHMDEYKRKRIQNLMTTGDKIQQLKELNELKSAGTVTEQEFEVIKSEILK